VVPVVRRLLADDVTPVGLYRQLSSGRPGTFILESATDGVWSRWSFVGVSARAILTERAGQAVWNGDVPVSVPTEGDVLTVLRETLAALHTPSLDHLPPSPAAWSAPSAGTSPSTGSPRCRGGQPASPTCPQ